MQKRLDRLRKIIELSQADLVKSELMMQEIRSKLQLNNVQLDSLNGYQNEYLRQLKSNQSTTLQKINQTQAFLGKLNQAIQHQQIQISELEQSLEKVKEVWLEKRKREQALEKLYKKLEKKHFVKLEKQEQKMMDDLIASNFSYTPL
jgi:flagellar FliJ protein